MFRSRTTLAAAAACLAALACAPGAQSATPQEIRDAVADGADWLDTQQAANGTFTGFGGNTAYSAMSAAGRHPADTANGAGTNAQDALVNTLVGPTFTAAPNLSTDAASRPAVFERSILESEASGIDSRRIAANQNLLAQLAAYYNGGYFNVAPNTANPERRSTNYAVFGALALTRAGAPRFLLDQSVRVIRQNQHNDGGWDFPLALSEGDKAGVSDVDTTGATLAALCETGLDRNDEAVQAGVNFLKTKLNADGSFVSFTPNVSTNAWAVAGLNKCGIDAQGAEFTTNSGDTPVDFILSQQNPDGGFYSAYSNPNAPSDVYSTQDALRPLTGAAFSASPPTRANPANPRRRAVPAVADGTTVPVALAVDDGAGTVTFCRVAVPSGASLAAVLAQANTGSTPGACATGGEFTGGQLSKLNGQTGTWGFSVNGGGEQVAANQAVRFGDLVALRRTSNAVPATPGPGAGTPAATPIPAAEQAKTTPTGVASKSLKASAKKRVVTVSLACAKDNRLCQGSVYLVYKGRTLVRRAFLIGGGKTSKLNLKLSKGSMKKLGRSKKKVKVNVFSRDGNGVASTSTRTVTLTPTK